MIDFMRDITAYHDIGLYRRRASVRSGGDGIDDVDENAGHGIEYVIRPCPLTRSSGDKGQTYMLTHLYWRFSRASLRFLEGRRYRQDYYRHACYVTMAPMAAFTEND